MSFGIKFEKNTKGDHMILASSPTAGKNKTIGYIHKTDAGWKIWTLASGEKRSTFKTLGEAKAAVQVWR